MSVMYPYFSYQLYQSNDGDDVLLPLHAINPLEYYGRSPCIPHLSSSSFSIHTFVARG
jgi:hypothetical protein